MPSFRSPSVQSPQDILRNLYAHSDRVQEEQEFLESPLGRELARGKRYTEIVNPQWARWLDMFKAATEGSGRNVRLMGGPSAPGSTLIRGLPSMGGGWEQDRPAGHTSERFEEEMRELEEQQTVPTFVRQAGSTPQRLTPESAGLFTQRLRKIPRNLSPGKPNLAVRSLQDTFKVF